MSKHLNISTIIDKNKIASENAFLVLVALTVKDSAGATVETLRFARNSENVTFQGNEYQAANFDIKIQTAVNEEPTISLSARDQTRTLSAYIEAYDGLVKSEVKLYVVNSGSLTAPPELEEDFLVTSASVSEYVANLTLGVESAVAQRFPNYRQFKERCAWKYKGIRCQYAGPMATCDFTRDGPNGCVAHGNEINFGGYPGIVELL